MIMKHPRAARPRKWYKKPSRKAKEKNAPDESPGIKVFMSSSSIFSPDAARPAGDLRFVGIAKLAGKRGKSV
jgi:hypothetical protein